jgi:hypothetical protein
LGFTFGNGACPLDGNVIKWYCGWNWTTPRYLGNRKVMISFWLLNGFWWWHLMEHIKIKLGSLGDVSQYFIICTLENVLTVQTIMISYYSVFSFVERHQVNHPSLNFIFTIVLHHFYCKRGIVLGIMIT